MYSAKELKQICKTRDVSYKLVQSRLSRGWELEDALTVPNQKDEAQVDHLGNRYQTTRHMCEAWGVSYSTFRYLFTQGLTKKEILSGEPEPNSIPVKDHKGNSFPTVVALARHYNMSAWLVYQQMLVEGKDFETILNLPRFRDRIDHEGTVFKSRADMCEHWGIPESTFIPRRKAGWDKRRALTTPIKIKTARKSTEIIDYKGTKYENLDSLCETYGITTELFLDRQRHGWTIERILTTPVVKYEATDHKGIKYKGLKSMCKAYGIALTTFRNRESKGWSVEKSLTNPYVASGSINRALGVKIAQGRYYTKEDEKSLYFSCCCPVCGQEAEWTFQQIKNHIDQCGVGFTGVNGEFYEDAESMCAQYPVQTAQRYYDRRQKGYSKEKALTLPVRAFGVTDYLGNEFPTLKSLCEYYHLSLSTYLNRLESGWSLEKTLTNPPAAYLRQRFKNLKIHNSCFDTEDSVYYVCEIKKSRYIWNYADMLEHEQSIA